MKDRLALPFRFDADAMRRDLLLFEGRNWTDHFVPQHYEGTWSVLPLRAPAGARHPIQMIYSDPACDDFADTSLLAECSYFPQVLAAFACPLHAIRLMKLTPGSMIKPHRDHDLAAEYGRVRLHIPVTTNPDVDFWLNGERVVMREGECWYLRLSDPHSVANRSQTDRVHLVVDALLNPWLEEQLVQAERAAGTPDALVHRSSHVIRASGGGRPSDARPPTSDARLPTYLTGPGLALEGWIPYSIRQDAGRHVVDWCHLGEDTFAAPFFEQTIAHCLRKPFNQQVAHATPIDALIGWCRARPGLTPTAFIFHGSRCGSTLVSQLARALPRTIVISEAPPIDHVLRAHVPNATRVEWLRALVSALGQPRRGDERHLFVKFDAWHVMDLALVRRAFPGVPCVFVYREPTEVIASQMRMPSQFLLDARLRSSLLGPDAPALSRVSDREESCARVLAAIYAAALAGAASGAVLLLNFEELPEAGVSCVIQWCTFDCSGDARARLQHVAEFDAKNPSLPYDATEGSTRRPPSERALKMAARFVAPYYSQLEAIRLSGSLRTEP